MDFNNNEVGKALGQVLTLQYDYPPNGEGSVGYKGNNLYRFRMEDVLVKELNIINTLIT